MRDRRDTRAHRAGTSEGIEPGSPEETRVPPPSQALMDHLWDQFGKMVPSPLSFEPWQCAVDNALWVARLELLNYLDDLLKTGA